MNEKKNKKSPVSAVVLIFVLLSLMNAFVEADNGEAIILLVSLAVTAALIFVAIKVLKSAGRPKTGEQKQASSISFSGGKKTETEKAIHYERGQERKAEKYAAYDHDTAHRLEQLDSFLKNGLIDKKEYRLLRERYLKGN